MEQEKPVPIEPRTRQEIEQIPEIKTYIESLQKEGSKVTSCYEEDGKVYICRVVRPEENQNDYYTYIAEFTPVTDGEETRYRYEKERLYNAWLHGKLYVAYENGRLYSV